MASKKALNYKVTKKTETETLPEDEVTVEEEKKEVTTEDKIGLVGETISGIGDALQSAPPVQKGGTAPIYQAEKLSDSTCKISYRVGSHKKGK